MLAKRFDEFTWQWRREIRADGNDLIDCWSPLPGQLFTTQISVFMVLWPSGCRPGKGYRDRQGRDAVYWCITSAPWLATQLKNSWQKMLQSWYLPYLAQHMEELAAGLRVVNRAGKIWDRQNSAKFRPCKDIKIYVRYRITMWVVEQEETAWHWDKPWIIERCLNRWSGGRTGSCNS